MRGIYIEWFQVRIFSHPKREYNVKAMKQLCLSMVLAVNLAGQDCPRFPLDSKQEWNAAIDLDRAGERQRRIPGARYAVGLTRSNLIDEFLFRRMETDGVPIAGLATDEEFLRRATLDLNGRIPTVERVEKFIADKSAGKRQTLVDELLQSSAFTDQFSFYWLDRFQVTAVPGITLNSFAARNDWASYVRDFVKKDRPYQDFVTEILTAKGGAEEQPAAGWLIRQWAEGLPMQDLWDNVTDQITTQFLGFRTDCISCHNGRGHLEKINLGLTRRPRNDFFQMSAFLSRLQWATISADVDGSSKLAYLVSRAGGAYDGAVDPSNPGPRPPRLGGPYTPKYFATGEEPQSGDYRGELARFLTRDRQFARAAVNYMWAYFFRYGIVDPPNNWDLSRIDRDDPPPQGWALQNSNPELLDALTSFFIENNYRFGPLIRLITSSTSYQLSSKFGGTWKPSYTQYFAKFHPRRLSAEQFYDSINTAAMAERPLPVRGQRDLIYYANQLPDANEPKDDWRVRTILENLGRGDWYLRPKTQEPSLLQLLYLMNSDQIVILTHTTDPNVSLNRVIRVDAEAKTDEEAVRTMFLATLSRVPTAEEVKTILALGKNRVRREWLSDLQWALFNKSDFWFNY